MKKIALFMFLALLTLACTSSCSSVVTASDDPATGQRWSQEKIWQWYEDVGVIKGCNYLPRTATNSTEMWQKETFDSKTIDEANHNYGQTVSVWDWVFGTRYLPADREPPEDIGIPNLEAFPMTWWAQILSPFRWKHIKQASATAATNATIDSQSVEVSARTLAQ